MDSDPGNKKPNRKALRRILMIGGPLAAVIVGLLAYVRGGRVIASDNAYVRAEKLAVTTEVAGSVVEIAVRDNESVGAGQLLCRIDDSAYRNAVNEAQAQLIAARTELATMRASYRQKQALIAEAGEQVAFAERELERQQTLASGDVSTAAELDKARHALKSTRNRVEVLRQDAATVLASLGGDLNRSDDQFARVAAAQARLATAERNAAKTVLRAPFAGVATNVSNIALGKYLAAGQPAFSIIGSERIWLEANLKETELTFVRVGNPVRLSIDAYPRREWVAKVTAIGPATGSEFAVIPAQNASGNWVKVVQRVPVRIELAELDPERPLRAGMSAEVRIDTGHERHLGDLLPGHRGN